MQMNIKCCFANDSHQQEVLKIVGDSSIKPTIKMQLNSLIIGDHTSIEFQKCASLSDHDFAAIGHSLY